ncbi:hypothetical protein [Saccharomonospora sp. CUA-673]|uniref:hypothetical protein n=1 Tax=Saccharomonospora sp. CUA-673 TaxID=1904969 RepID=UPI00210174C2|nr:hypothetical protein [Saccharomonospora sp. CUA-673]
MTEETAVLSARSRPLIDRYRGLICDLDGVVYRGATAVPNAVETISRLTGDGVPVAFATNNASRPPELVGDHLRDIGLAPGGWSVVTSSQPPRRISHSGWRAARACTRWADRASRTPSPRPD